MKDYRQIEGMIKQMDECLHHAYDRGYKKGFDDGHEKGMIDGVMNIDVNEVSYVKGLNDAWECARELMLSTEDSGIDNEKIEEIFGYSYYYVLKDYSASEAIAKIKEYEEKQKKADEIHVGDEVYNLDLENVRVVTAIYNDDKGHKQAVQICKNGKYAVDRVDTLRKTGKHYYGIEHVLYEMKGENE